MTPLPAWTLALLAPGRSVSRYLLCATFSFHFFLIVSSTPVPSTNCDPVNLPTLPSSADAGVEIISTSSTAKRALLWTSIGLAVLLALVQSLVTTMASIAEDSRAWTFRFRIALYEHWWWTGISVLLTISLVLIILSFLAGNDGEALSILVLSSAAAMTIVRFAVPAWRGRRFIRNRWLAWTGASRSAIPRSKALLCGNEEQWRRLYNHLGQLGVKWSLVPSDEWGWTLRSPAGIAPDATDILGQIIYPQPISPQQPQFAIADDSVTAASRGSPVYNDGFPTDTLTVSLQWGPQLGFRRRVSRGITSMPVNLLLSNPLTADGFAGEGICLAMGILGRNKGLQPKTLVFNITSGSPISHLENGSAWAPRPQKVLRSYYELTMKTQYGGLGKPYVAAATELALILVDCPGEAVEMWLENELAQQDVELNRLMQGKVPTGTVTEEDFNATYRASYVAMVMSLNNLRWERGSTKRLHKVVRPDLLCGALLRYAETKQVPNWWGEPWAVERVKTEIASLCREWMEPMAQLLGLAQWPQQMSLTQGVVNPQLTLAASKP